MDVETFKLWGALGVAILGWGIGMSVFKWAVEVFGWAGAMVYIYLLCFAFSLPVCWVEGAYDQVLTFSAFGLGMCLITAVCFVSAQAGYNYAVQGELGMTIMVTSSYPAIGLLFGLIFFGESYNLYEWIGFGVIVVGLTLVFYGDAISG